MISRNYIFPGLIAVVMMIMAAILTSLSMAREWETGTMEQLMATPLSGPELERFFPWALSEDDARAWGRDTS